MRCDVLVVGAGVAGSTLSMLLSSKGVDVIQIEAGKDVVRPHCSGIIGLNAWERLPFKRSSWIVDKISWAKLISPSGIVLRTDAPALVLDRERMDREISEEAVRRGTELLTEVRFLELKRKEKAVVMDREGKKEVQFRFIVGADGARSILREVFHEDVPLLTGVNLVTNEGPKNGYVVRIRRGSLFSWLHPRGSLFYSGAIGRGNEAFRWASSQVRQFSRVLGGMVPAKTMRRFVKWNLALIGDSAGQVKPLSRGGVFYITEASKILAEEIIRSLETEKNLLEEYEKRWWSLLGKEVVMGELMRNMMDSMSDREIDLLFSMLGEIHGFSTDFQSSSILRGAGIMKSLAVGLRFPFKSAKSFIKLFLPWLNLTTGDRTSVTKS